MLALAITMLAVLAAFAFMRLNLIVTIGLSVLLAIVIIALAIVPRKAVIGKPAANDERLRKAEVYAAYYAWSLSFAFVCLAGLAAYANLLTINTTGFVILVGSGMALTKIGYQLYFTKRGDVE